LIHQNDVKHLHGLKTISLPKKSPRIMQYKFTSQKRPKANGGLRATNLR